MRSVDAGSRGFRSRDERPTEIPISKSTQNNQNFKMLLITLLGDVVMSIKTQITRL